VVDVALSSIGKSFGMVGAESVGARENLIDMFGGLDAFDRADQPVRQAFLSEAEQMAPVQAAVAKAMADLGLAGITTKDAFKQTVLGLDLTTEAGELMYAQLLTIAPAFAKVQDYLAKLNGTVEDTAKTAEQLAAIEKERRGLEIQLMEATGDAAGALAAKRADELAATDESNRALRRRSMPPRTRPQKAADAQGAGRRRGRGGELAGRQQAAVMRPIAARAEPGAKPAPRPGDPLMEATGDAAGALAERRADELAALDAEQLGAAGGGLCGRGCGGGAGGAERGPPDCGRARQGRSTSSSSG
jgi:hypothetical protein